MVQYQIVPFLRFDMESVDHTNLANNLVVLEQAPGYVDAIVVPVGPWHKRIDVGVHARHAGHMRAGLLVLGIRLAPRWALGDKDEYQI